MEVLKLAFREVIAEQRESIQTLIAPDENVYIAEVDRARDLLLAGNPVAAKQIIDSLSRLTAQANISTNLRFRIRAILGGCELELDDYQGATQIFEDALQYAPDSAKAIANVALAKLLQGDFEAARLFAEKALGMQGAAEQTSAAAVYVHAVASLRNFHGIDDLLNEAYLNNTDYLRAMGFIFLKAKDFSKAEDMYRRAIAIDENDAYSLVMLAQVLTFRETEPLKGKVFASTLEDDALPTKLSESEELLDRAISVFQKRDNRKRFHDALADRAGVRIARGNFKGAAIDCEKVLSEEPKHVVALYNRAHVAHEAGDFGSAIQLLSAIPETEWNYYGIWSLLVKAFLQEGRLQDAHDLLERVPDEFEESHLVGMFLVRSEVLLEQEAFEALESLKSSILAAHPNHGLLLEAAAYIEHQQNHKDAALHYSIEAYQSMEGADRERLALRIASYYYDAHGFEEAIPYYEQVGKLLSSDNPSALRYLDTLYRAHHYAETFRVAQCLRAQGSRNPYVMETLAWINEQTGDLKNASATYTELTRLCPDDPKYLVAQASVDFRRGEIESVRAILRLLKNASINDAHDLFATAELLAFLGEKEDAIRLAHRARQIGFEKPENHLIYLQIFHYCSSADPDIFEAKEVAEDTAVLVQEVNGPKRWIIIYGSLPADRAKNEFSKDDPTAQSLLGHHSGDTVPIRQSQIENLSYTIEAIQSIYVRAYQDSIENFGTWFPQDNSIFKMHFDGDPTKLLTVVAGQSVHLDQIYQLYDKGYLTFSQFAALAGKNEIDLWGGLVGKPNCRLLASLGTAEEQQQHLKCAQESRQITLDLTALLTSWHLGILALLPKRFEKLYIPQSVFDAISIRIINMRMIGRDGLKFISFEDGHFGFHEISKESIELGVRKLEELRDFVIAHCEVVPLEPGTLPIFDDKKPGYLTDQSAFATLLVAKQTKSNLYADDLRLRVIGATQMGILGFWTQPLLKSLADQKIITDQDSFEKFIQLITAHYYFTAINPDLLIYVLQKHNMSITTEVMDVLNTLRGPDTNEIDAIGIVAACLEKVWLQVWLFEQKVLVLDQCLTVATANRQGLIVLQRIAHLLRGSLKLQIAGLHLNELIKQINFWCQIKMREGKI